jgi:uncharacterized protein (UPF0548 family)
MFLLRKPSDAQIREYLSQQAEQQFSYAPTGGTRDYAFVQYGWDTDQHQVLLGHGEAVFQRAKEAIDSWRMFPTKVATLCWPRLPREGLNVAVLYWASPLRIWLLFTARVVYVVDETVPSGKKGVERYGFAYGTLPDHPECGEAGTTTLCITICSPSRSRGIGWRDSATPTRGMSSRGFGGFLAWRCNGRFKRCPSFREG